MKLKYSLFSLLIIILVSFLNAQNYPPHKRLSETRYNSGILDNDWVNEQEGSNQSNDNLVTHVLYPYPEYKWGDPQTGMPLLDLNYKYPENKEKLTPLLLIHGWNPERASRDPNENIVQTEAAEVRWDKFCSYFLKTPTLYKNFRLFLYRYPSYKHITYNAKILKELIANYNELNTKQIIIIAHSMGGLVSRSLIEEHNCQNIQALITLGTPHHGSPGAINHWVDLAPLKDVDTPGANDLFWDNYDGIFEWAKEDMKIFGTGRLDDLKKFDDAYRTKCINDRLVPVDIIYGEYDYFKCKIPKTPNPWLTWLNEKFLKSQRKAQYILYGSFDDNDYFFGNSENNYLKDAFPYNITSNIIFDKGYVNDGIVPVTSCFLDNKKHIVNWQNPNNNLFEEIYPGKWKVAIFNDFLVNKESVILSSTDETGIQIRFLKDFNHDRMKKDAENDFYDDFDKQKYQAVIPSLPGMIRTNYVLFDYLQYDLLKSINYTPTENDLYEPNDNFSLASKIDVGVKSQEHSIQNQNDVDYLKFDVIQGYGYTIQFEEEQGVDVKFILYDNAQKRISSDWGSDLLHFFGVNSGIYYVKVYRSGGAQTGNYKIRILPAYWNSSPSLSWDLMNEPNPAYFNAPLLKTNGTFYFNRVENGNDEDYFRFTASKGISYTINLSEEKGSTVRFILYFENESHNLERLTTDWGIDSYEFNCQHTGNYIIKVFRDGGLTEGEYKIHILATTTSYEVSVFPSVIYLYPGGTHQLFASSSTSTGINWTSSDNNKVTVDKQGRVTAQSIGFVKIRATSANSNMAYDDAMIYVIPADNYEPNNNFSFAKDLAVGMNYQAHSIQTVNDEDYLKFNAIQGYGYTVRLEHEIGADVRFIVYDHLQKRLSTDWGSDQFHYICANSGLNYLKVYRVGESDMGNYAIRVLPAYWNHNSDLAWEALFEPNPVWYNAPILKTDGSAYYNHIEYGNDEDYFRFTASKGISYTINLSEERGSSVRFILYFENEGHNLERLTTDWGIDSYEFNCQHTGSYIIKVYRDDGLTEGDYKINILATSTSYEVSVFPNVLYLYPGGLHQLFASSSMSKGIDWISSDNTKVTVNNRGQIIANNVGFAMIRATSKDSKASYDEALIHVIPAENYEPNNNFSLAKFINVGTEYQAHSIQTTNDEDYLKFNAVQGYGYTVRLEQEIGADVRFIVYDHLQKRLSTDWGSDQFHYICANSGVNYIKVYRVGDLDVGNYAIRVIPAYWNHNPELTWDNFFEPNPIWYSAPILKTDGSVYYNNVEYGNDEDYFRFTASKGISYTINLSEEKGSTVRFILYFENEGHNLERLTTDWGIDSYEFNCQHTGNYILKVYRDGGLTEGDYMINILATNTNYEVSVFPNVLYLYPGGTHQLFASSSMSSGINWSSSDDTKVTVNGQGQITANSVGFAKIRATSKDSKELYDEALIHVLPIDNYEPNSNFSLAKLTDVGVGYQAHSIQSANDEDYIKFNVVQGYGYTVRSEQEIGADVRFIVYDHLQKRLSTDWGSDLFQYICTSTGINFIKVYRVGDLDVGNYAIRVIPAYWNHNPDLIWDNFFEPNPVWYNAPLLMTDGTIYYNQIEYGNDEDYFRFIGSIGNSYTINLSEEKSSTVRFILYFENEGHNLERLTTDWGVDNYNFNCQKDGNYIIKVYRDGGLTEGDYLINIYAGTAVDDPKNIQELPKEFKICQNYPNPFNPETRITYSLPEQSAVTLIVFDVNGNEIRTLFEGNQAPGNYTFVWDAKDENGFTLASGIYFYQLKLDKRVETKKMLLLK